LPKIKEKRKLRVNSEEGSKVMSSFTLKKKINCKGQHRADKWYPWHLELGDNMCAFYWLLRMSNLVDFQVVMTEKETEIRKRVLKHDISNRRT
jgi:hypothetical protein